MIMFPIGRTIPSIQEKNRALLAFGAMPDGLFLKRSGSELIGASIPAPSSPSAYSAENKAAVPTWAGMVVSVHFSGSGIYEANDTSAARTAIGIAQSVATIGNSVNIITGGPLELADWTATTGSASLIPRAYYYLVDANGQLSTTAPSVAGKRSQSVGIALTANILLVEIEVPILL